jgi:endo-1,4-beta-D-glucanase Y
LKLAYIEDHGKVIDNKDQVQTQEEDGVAYKLELLLLLNVNYNSSRIFFGAKTFSDSIGA